MTNTQSHPDGRLSDEEIAWLVSRARGGFGHTVTAAAYVDPAGQAWAGAPRAQAVVDRGGDAVVIGKAAIVDPDFGLHAMANPAYEAPEFPVIKISCAERCCPSRSSSISRRVGPTW